MKKETQCQEVLYKRLFLTMTFLFNLLLASFAQQPLLLEHGSGVRTVAVRKCASYFGIAILTQEMLRMEAEL